MHIRHEPHAVDVAKNRTLATDGLGDERLLPVRMGAEPHDRRVELDELEIGELRASAQCQRDTVPGGHVGIRGLPEDLTESSRRENDGGSKRGIDAVALALTDDVEGHALGRTLVVDEQVERQGVLDELDARILGDRGHECA